ncbi:hypothetical protein ECC02_007205 [Trypanosoma cruzi]|uniref:Mitochondrial carrier protein n=1 Tax=Trypanosoma cruzi TaxID=5693 RepID=A0A7J6XZC4_TRYCR|nr:hypothetical protein ECC02_007205 [Trypanosoma cruzi]
MDGEMILTFLPGAAQGLTTVALGHPLDTAKTRMQAVGPRASRSFVCTIWSMVRAEGARSLYRGVTPPLVMSATKRSLQFAVWDTFRQHDIQRTSHGDSPSYVSCTFSEILAWIGASPFRSGAIAGGFGTLIGCPMHVIKIQTQFSTRCVTKNAWTCAIDIYRNEGFCGYYRGFRYHVVKDIFFASCYLGLYDASRRWLCELFSVFSQQKWGPRATVIVGDSTEYFTSQSAFLAGSIASMATWTLLYPLDTIKTIVQARNIGFLQVTDIFRREISAMYRGIGVSLVRAGPVSGAAMVVYELAKSKTDQLLLQNRRGHTAAGENGKVRC